MISFYLFCISLLRVQGKPCGGYSEVTDYGLNGSNEPAKFCFTLRANTIIAKAGTGFYTNIDLAIAKCHFEAGAGKDNFIWVL